MKRINDGHQTNLIGSNIKAARIKSGLSQKQLSEKLETLAIYVCRGSMSRIENGQRIVTDIEILGISKILNIPIERLFDVNFDT